MRKFIFLFISITILTSCGSNQKSEENLALILFSQEEVNKDLAAKNNKLDNKIDLAKILKKCSNQKELDAMKFLYAYMPTGDIIDYDSDYYLNGIKAALLARSEMPWGAKIPDDIFRHFVLPLRIDNEDMTDSRPVLYKELKNRVKGLSMYDAALEVNYWCHEKVIVSSSDNERYKEEPILAISALRAIGIPARLVYTPRWGHTDDSHEWVEVWIDETWHYLGACEPEPRLNVAWFSSTAKRGLLMHTKVFGKYNHAEEITSKNAHYTEINITENYAPVEKIKIKVVDKSNKKVEGAKVEFKIYSFAEFYSALTAITDTSGIVSATLGKGDILVWASKGHLFGYKKVSVGREDKIISIQLNKDLGEVFNDELEITPPIERRVKNTSSKDEIAENTLRLTKGDSIRKTHTNSYAKHKDAQYLRRKVAINTRRLNKFLVDSRENWKETYSYLQATRKSPYIGARLLDEISIRDLQSTPSEVLLDHFDHFSSKVTETNLNYVLNPIIADEKLSPWRGKFQDLAKKKVFISYPLTPESIIAFTNKIKILDNYNTAETPISPIGVYNLMTADKKSRDIFFVALCRSAGIPARIEKTTNKTEYYQNYRWHSVSFNTESEAITSPKGSLRIRYKGQRFINNPKYGTHFSIAKIEKNSIRTLDFSKKPGYSGIMSWRSIYRKYISLEEGYYKLTTGTRMANGKVLATINFFEILDKQTTTVELLMRKDPTELQVIGEINPELKFSKVVPDNKRARTSILKSTDIGFFVLCFMRANHEPSNKATRNLFSKSPKRPTFVLYQNEEEYNKHRRGSFPDPPEGILMGIDTKQSIFNAISRETRLRTVEYPLFVIADTQGRIVYISDGYNVAIADQLDKLGE